jgi:broad specificity phosphatase PhoE
MESVLERVGAVAFRPARSAMVVRYPSCCEHGRDFGDHISLPCSKVELLGAIHQEITLAHKTAPIAGLFCYNEVTMKIYLVRHGETTGDVEDRYGGDYDDHLTDKGREQARALAEKLKYSGIEILFCSPKIRARETAEIVAREIGCEVNVVDEVRERNSYGILTGMVKSEAREKYPEHTEALRSYRHKVPGSENYERFGERVNKALDEIVKQSYKTIAILSHGGPISFIFREILKLGEVKIEDCGFAEIEYTDGAGFSLVATDGIIQKK